MLCGGGKSVPTAAIEANSPSLLRALSALGETLGGAPSLPLSETRRGGEEAAAGTDPHADRGGCVFFCGVSVVFYRPAAARDRPGGVFSPLGMFRGGAAGGIVCFEQVVRLGAITPY